MNEQFKKASAKEIVLLIILFILLGFYFINKGPFESKQEELEAERSSVQKQINELQPKLNQMDLWQEELNAVYAKYGNNPKSISDYDDGNNISNIMNEMSFIFDENNDSSYSFSFSDPSLNDHIVTRNIKIHFSCYEYEQMIEKLRELNTSEYRYRITDLSISESASDLYSVDLGLIVYEYEAGESLN